MPEERQPQVRLEGQQYLDLPWFLASTSPSMISAVQEVYGKEVFTIGPKNEPENGKSRHPATAKNNEVSIPLLTENPDIEGLVLSADVVFYWNGKKEHRADRGGELTDEQLKKHQKKAKRRYSRPFSARWEVTFAANVLHTQLRRLLTLKIPIHSDTGLSKEKIQESATPTSNAMIRLVEAAKKKATFAIAHKDIDKTEPLSAEMAEILIASKILPQHALLALLTEEKTRQYMDHSGNTWEIPLVDVGRLFRE